MVIRRHLATGRATPSQIAADAELNISHVSRTLHDLHGHGLVEVRVSDDRQKGRVYESTDPRTDIWQTIEEHNLTEAPG